MSTTISGLNKLLSGFDELIRDIPDAKAQMLDAMGKAMKERVDQNISSALTDSHGKVRSWQNYHKGTGLGYAAVRPNGSGEGEATGYGSPGHITNILENGRKGRGLTQERVSGYHFYKNARTGIKNYAVEAAEACANRLIEHLED